MDANVAGRQTLEENKSLQNYVPLLKLDHSFKVKILLMYMAVSSIFPLSSVENKYKCVLFEVFMALTWYHIPQDSILYKCVPFSPHSSSGNNSYKSIFEAYVN